jgi:hypothetical protein
MIWGLDEFLLLGIAIALLALALEAGFQLGQRNRAHRDEHFPAHIRALQTALLGLLALLLGFTFSMSISRFDARKDLVLEEANAIGTAYLRAKFLPDRSSGDVAALFRDYVAARIDFHAASNDPAGLAAATAKAAAIEARLWAYSVDLAQQQPGNLPVGLFIQALNNVIDVNEKRQVALENHVPEAVILLLFIVSAFSIGFIGFSQGLTGRRRAYSTMTFAVLIALVLTVILDIDRPKRGLVQVSQASLLRLQAGMTAEAGPLR